MNNRRDNYKKKGEHVRYWDNYDPGKSFNAPSIDKFTDKYCLHSIAAFAIIGGLFMAITGSDHYGFLVNFTCGAVVCGLAGFWVVPFFTACCAGVESFFRNLF